MATEILEMKTGNKITVFEQYCTRCEKTFWPKIKDGKIFLPKNCPHCNNPYWNHKYTRTDMVQKHKK